MILLGGHASSGKTLLSILTAMTQAKAGYKVGYYSLETKPEKMADRIISSLSKVTLGKIKNREFKPVAALRAGGSRHYSKQQLDEREAREVKAPPAKDLAPPVYLTEIQAKKFRELAPILISMGVLSSLDADGLARDLIAEQNYLRATNRLTKAMNIGNTAEADKWSAMQDQFFRQCRTAGSDLGLTVSGRARLKLSLGYKPEDLDGEEADLFGDN